MSEITVVFIRDLAKQFSALEPLLLDHIEANGEVLPHVFFYSVALYAVGLLKPSTDATVFALSDKQLDAFQALIRKSPRGRLNELTDLLRHLEDAYASGDDEIQNLIAVSFIENLPHRSERGAEILDMLGPNMRRQLNIWLGR